MLYDKILEPMEVIKWLYALTDLENQNSRKLNKDMILSHVVSVQSNDSAKLKEALILIKLSGNKKSIKFFDHTPINPEN